MDLLHHRTPKLNDTRQSKEFTSNLVNIKCTTSMIIGSKVNGHKIKNILKLSKFQNNRAYAIRTRLNNKRDKWPSSKDFYLLYK